MGRHDGGAGDEVAHLRTDLSVSDGEIDELAGRPLAFATTWGLFSPRALDDGTRVLLRHLVPKLKPTCSSFEIGCGWGPIGCTLAAVCPRGRHVMVDRDFLAVEYAELNAAANGLTNVTCRPGHGFMGTPPTQRFDLVVSNLPAKTGGEMLEVLLHDAHRHLNPGGLLCVVTVTGLRRFIQRHMNDRFGNYKKLKQTPGYTVALTRRD